MHPILAEFGFLTVHTYGLMVASGFLIGIMLAAQQGKREGLDPQVILDLCFFILVSAILGARFLYVVIEYEQYLEHPLKAFMFWQGGLVYYGGLIAAVATGWYFIRKKNLPTWQVADLIAPSLAIGQGVGRWGCLFAGCCYGAPTDLPWGITFTNENSLAPQNIALHPTQIYLSLNGLLIFGILIWMRKKKSFHGQIFWMYGILYSIGRFIIEFFRNDNRGSVFGGVLSTSQFIGIFVLCLSIYMMMRLKTRKELILHS
ncbi:MAG: prolipoprotein diacylglyceryl transferase [Candidatus Nitronauta litoralis]|uniref:Phosphatidylglycerol--prolipoprotein diacylglyceryl transferase n=1 Tax=Candidatus Nitronauta litoralis TaxID=2705533 RepID=A0A7T0G0Z8_9BACT|nr:MAG: prolipoprotein diacylglyceryl transferase [Candidatus Nitronauta litoralis]